MARASYHDEITAWRQAREKRLAAEEGWLAVAGLVWLTEGENAFGTDPASAVLLPPGSAPAHIGSFALQGGRVTLGRVQSDAVLVDGQAVATEPLRTDADDEPNRITINDLVLYLIRRGERVGVRIYDKQNPARRHFQGLNWFPVDESYRLIAAFTAYDEPRTVAIDNMIGDTLQMQSPGYVDFRLDGQECRLEPVSTETELWFIFSDATSGRTSYGAGRYLYTDAPATGQAVLDFNKAVNPPCAYTPHATCPLPPPQNRLSVGIAAGEREFRA